MALIEDFCKKFTQIHEMLPYIRRETQFTHASKFKSRRKVTLKCFTKKLNNRAWINERESPESGIFNVECKYWTLLLWESFVEALNESNFCCFVLFQTIIIIVNRAGSRAMLANFYFNCCDFVELLFETINCWPKTVWNVRQKLCFSDKIKNLKYQLWCFHLGVIVE